jgi:hypothetical protein
LTFFRAKIGRKKRIRTVRTAEQKEFESEVSLEKMYGLHNEYAFLVGTKKANFLSQVRFLFGLQFSLKKVNCSLLVGPFFWGSVRRPEQNSHFNRMEDPSNQPMRWPTNMLRQWQTNLLL